MEKVTCTRCKSEKPATLYCFPVNKRKKNGLDSWCKQCRATYRSTINRGRFRNVISDGELVELKLSTKSCVVCGNTDRLGVDHDHNTGKVRGILCSNCNAGIGFFKDDPYLLEFARIYILSSRDDPEAEEYLNSCVKTCSNSDIERVK